MTWREETLAEGVRLICADCREVLPTLGKVDDARKQATDSDRLSANPSKWPTTRGVNAVAEKLLNTIYGDECKEWLGVGHYERLLAASAKLQALSLSGLVRSRED